MAFALTDEQRELQRSARAVLAELTPLESVGAVADSVEGWDPASWDALAELGWLGVTVDEDLGGAGLGLVELTLLLEEFGYALYVGPYLATVALALPALPPEDRARVAAGETRWSAEIDGLVPELRRVDAVVTAAGTSPPVGEELETIDPTRPLARLAAGPSGVGSAASSAIVQVALAAEALGVAQRALDVAVAYARERRQFGRPIGSFQAVSHPLADTFADVELARSLAYAAAWKLDADAADADRSAAAAKAFATDAAVVACERAIQVHGGIGFTWEHPLHRFYKRALWLQAFAGHPARHRAFLAERWVA